MARLSRESGQGETYVRDLIVGRVQDISGHALLGIARVLNTTSSYLLGETDSPDGVADINVTALLAASLHMRQQTSHMEMTPENWERLMRMIALAYPYALDRHMRGEPITFDEKTELAIYKSLAMAENLS